MKFLTSCLIPLEIIPPPRRAGRGLPHGNNTREGLNTLRGFLTGLIRFYQLTISPDHGVVRIFSPYGCCRYYPTCSEYAAQAVKKYGLYGLWLAVLRLLRCHPWSAGGSDPVRSLSSPRTTGSPVCQYGEKCAVPTRSPKTRSYPPRADKAEVRGSRSNQSSSSGKALIYPVRNNTSAPQSGAWVTVWEQSVRGFEYLAWISNGIYYSIAYFVTPPRRGGRTSNGA